MILGTLAVLAAATFAYGAERSLRLGEDRSVNAGEVSVDPIVQNIAEKALHEAMLGNRAKAGFAIVADPQTGRILAIANQDPKRAGYWSLGQRIEPASFMKTLVAAEAIETGRTSPEEKISCENGSYRFDGRVFHDWKIGGWDQLSTEDTIGLSSDICSMKLAEKVGPDGLLKMLERFGFGPDGSARNFPKAKAGTLPETNLIPAVAAGYSFVTSPLELIQAYGAIANRGVLLAPKSARSDSRPEIVRHAISVDTAEKMKGILRQVVLKGTGKREAQSVLYTTAGKTATSFIPDLTKWDLVDGKNKGNFAGFIGFAPVKDPRVEVYVGIEDPDDGTGAHGSTHAAPIFRRVIDEVLTAWKIPSDQI